jgi:cytochrome c-type biogenesis protein CcmH/NrfF
MSPRVLDRVKAAAIAGLVLALLAPVAAGTEAPAEQERWAYALAHELMSPYCPGRALAECPSPEADKLRRWIVDQARAGATREEVEEQLHRTFGDKIRQAPRAEGVGLVAYAVPVSFLAIGAFLLFRFLRRGGDA